jgi:hypothetical protein
VNTMVAERVTRPQNLLTIVTVTLEDRDDGGLRVYSDDLPGLILSGPDHDSVSEKIAPAIRALFEYKGYREVTVRAVQPLGTVLQKASPRDEDVHVHQQFVVEWPRAA